MHPEADPGLYKGAKVMYLDNTLNWPAAGDHTATGGASAAVSVLADATRVRVEGYLMSLTAGAAGTITLYEHDGVTPIHVMEVNNVGHFNPVFLPIGGPNGIEIDGGFAAQASSGLMIGYVLYQDLTDPTERL